jgi:hypothetical protein
MDGVEAVFTGKQIASSCADADRHAVPLARPSRGAVDTVRLRRRAGRRRRRRRIATSRAMPPTRSSSPTIRCRRRRSELAHDRQADGHPREVPEQPAVRWCRAAPASPDRRKIDDTAIDKAFADAEVVISPAHGEPSLAPTAMEPRGVVAHYEPAKAR